MISFLSNGQSKLQDRFNEANSEMNLRNMYQLIVWDMNITNEYLFNQTKGEVRYKVEEKGYEVIAKPKILGTFNLDNKTFLWSDKNPSINDELNDNVESFRNTLPKKYQKKKFKSSTNLNENLLSLFSYELGANAYDSKRQDNTIIYYSLMEIKIFKNNEKIRVMKPKSYIQLDKKQANVKVIQKFHKEKIQVNELLNKEKIDMDEALSKINKVHLNYWLNEDSYFSPGLCWPCDFNEKFVTELKEFKTDDDRVFVMYTSNQGYAVYNYAYEIDPNAQGTKIIINEF